MVQWPQISLEMMFSDILFSPIFRFEAKKKYFYNSKKNFVNIFTEIPLTLTKISSEYHNNILKLPLNLKFLSKFKVRS